MGKFHYWIHLNKEGKQLFGAVFPEGIVPVKVMLPQGATLQGQSGVQRVYKADWTQLSNRQQDALLSILSKKFEVPKEAIRDQFEKIGFVPLRSKYVSGAGTDQMGLFL